MRGHGNGLGRRPSERETAYMPNSAPDHASGLSTFSQRTLCVLQVRASNKAKMFKSLALAERNRLGVVALQLITFRKQLGQRASRPLAPEGLCQSATGKMPVAPVSPTQTTQPSPDDTAIPRRHSHPQAAQPILGRGGMPPLRFSNASANGLNIFAF